MRFRVEAWAAEKSRRAGSALGAGVLLALVACADQPVAPVSSAVTVQPEAASSSFIPREGTYVVRPSTAAFYGWAYVTTNNAVGSYVPGPGGQPGGLQSGSLKFETKSSTGGKPQFITNVLFGVKLADLTSLRYSTRIEAYATGQHLTHTLNVWIDRDGSDATTNDRHNLVYEPCYTTSCAAAIQPLDTWSTWDARAAGAIWWSTTAIPLTDFTVAGGSYKPLTTILSKYPDATIRDVVLQAGQGSGSNPWNNFVGYADGFAVSINNAGTITFDFEPDEVAPPVVTNVQAAPNPAPVSGAATLTADVSDATTGGSVIASAEYSIDGGVWTAMSATDLAFDEATESVTGAITAPATAGIYNVCVRGTDAPGNVSAAVCTSLVVYDPSAGFVTGGGWMDSPGGSVPTIAPTRVWDQGFEGDAGGWFDTASGWYGTLTRVASGTGGIASFSGAFHAEIGGDVSSAPMSRFDGYRGTWPGTWVAEVAVYLDPAWTNGVGFDYSVASNNSSGSHRRDFIFHVTKDVSTGKLLVAGSNNTNFAPQQNLENSNHYEVTTAGWYTLRHTFRDQGGVLAVDLQLVDAGGGVLWTETRSDPSDLIPSIVGGNRYAWFTHVTGIALAIDEHTLTLPAPVAGPTGKATFGFVSKYQKGKSTPTGQTEFVFSAGNINFHSSAYDWLIVNQAGTNAQFKGSGTINGAGNYSFMLWAGDGDKDTNPSTLDTFRIKIWDTATNKVVYDNQADTAISGGNIIVHVPKK